MLAKFLICEVDVGEAALLTRFSVGQVDAVDVMFKLNKIRN